jgi:hypothetical protein
VSDETLALLREIRDNQREAIALQREHLAKYLAQLDRVEKLIDRAEALQARGGRGLKFIVFVLLPVIFLALLVMMWPYVRYLASWLSS